MIDPQLAVLLLTTFFAGGAAPEGVAAGQSGPRAAFVFTEPGRPADIRKTYEGRCGKRSYLMRAAWSGKNPDGSIVALIAGGVPVGKSRIDALSHKFLAGRAITGIEIGECRGDRAVLRISTVDGKSPSGTLKFVEFGIGARGEVESPHYN